MVEKREKQHSQDEAAQDARPVYTAPQVMRLGAYLEGLGGPGNCAGGNAADDNCANQGSFAIASCNPSGLGAHLACSDGSNASMFTRCDTGSDTPGGPCSSGIIAMWIYPS